MPPPASPSSLLKAVTNRRFLKTGWPWRGLAYAASTAVFAGVLSTVLACPVGPIVVGIVQAGKGGNDILLAAPLTRPPGARSRTC